MKPLPALVALFFSFPAAAVPPVPDRFVGHWAGSPAACGSDIDDLILRITPRHITYWESEGPITAVTVQGGNAIALGMELSGEGDTWQATARFVLSADGDRLIDSTSIPGEAIVRYRCPAPADTEPDA